MQLDQGAFSVAWSLAGVGVLFGLVFGGASGRWVEAVFGPEDRSRVERGGVREGP